MRDILEEAGLSENEAKVYMALLGEEEATASAVAKAAGVHRSTTYLQLDNLADKGLVSYHVKDDKRYYHPAPPKALMERLESKKEKVRSILPRLNDLAPDPTVFSTEVYEGREGVKTFYQHLIEHADTVRAFGVTGKAYDVLQYSFPAFVDRCEEAGISARYLANPEAEPYLERLPDSMVHVRYLEEAQSAVTTIMYDETVAIQSLQEDNIFVVRIADAELADGYRSYFDFMWRAASPDSE